MIYSRALSEAIELGNNMASEVNNEGSELVQLIPDRMKLWDSLTATEQKQLLKVIKKRGWGA